MKADDFTLRDDFAAVTREQWRALVDRELAGGSFERELVRQTYEGIDLQPLYTREDLPSAADPSGFPGLPPFIRGSWPLGNTRDGWDIRQEHDAPSLEELNQAIFEDVAGGATSIVIRLDTAARSGALISEHGQAVLTGDGAPLRSSYDLERVLRGVDLRCATIALDAGASFLPAATWLAWAWSRRGMPPAAAQGSFNADPLGTLAEYVALGEHATRGTYVTAPDLTTPAERDALAIPTSRALEQLGTLAVWTTRKWPRATAINVDTSAYHRAGATAAQDLAFSIATGIEYLRASTGAGLDVSAAAEQITFTYSLGCRVLMSIAKLRAARVLWARVVEASGGDGRSSRMRMHVRTSERTLTRHDPHTNLLRTSACGFAAAVAGADSISTAPFESPLGSSDAASRRLARNTQLILAHEAQLHRVIDPAGGSYALERLTRELAETAWRLVQLIETRGGVAQALTSGWAALQLETARLARLEHRIAQRASAGADHAFADFDGGPPSTMAPAPWSSDVPSQLSVPLPIVDAAFDAPASSDRADPTLSRVRAHAADPSSHDSCALVTAVSEAVGAGARLDELVTALGARASDDAPTIAEELRP